jgi:hypothetical protein
MGKKTLSLLVGLLATVALLVVVADSVWLRVVLGVFVVVEFVALVVSLRGSGSVDVGSGDSVV